MIDNTYSCILEKNTSLIEIVKDIRTRSFGRTKIVFVQGDFNILHPGHLRFLNFSASCGDFLVVAVNGKDFGHPLMPEHVRLTAIQAVEEVDFAFILNAPVEGFLQMLKPAMVVKGKEFGEKYNNEKEVVESYGGRLIFSSGDLKFSSIELLRKEFSGLHIASIVKPMDYPSRHGFDMHILVQILRKFSNLKIVVIGDLIVDEYVFCDAIGISQEDPTVVVRPVKKEVFVGGAGIVSAHASMLGANVSFFTCTNKDTYSSFAEQKLKEYGVIPHIILDETRQTTVKKRYQASKKTLLRVNNLRDHDISNELCKQLIEQVQPELESADLLIFSDFNYGVLPQTLVDVLTACCKKRGIKVAADSQSSSQLGDISRYRDMDLITPTEREARLALQDFKSGIVHLIETLINKTKASRVLLTLGEEGVLVYSAEERENVLKTDKLPAFNPLPRDVAGAGDSLLTCSSMCLAAGASIWEAAYMGSVAAACQVGRVGNIPLTKEEILVELT